MNSISSIPPSCILTQNEVFWPFFPSLLKEGLFLKYFSLQKWSRCSEPQQKPLRRIQVRKNTGFSFMLWEINYLPWFFPSYHLKMPIKLYLQQDFNPMFTPWQVSMINHQGYHVKIRLNSQCSVLNDFFYPKWGILTFFCLQQ